MLVLYYATSLHMGRIQFCEKPMFYRVHEQRGSASSAPNASMMRAPKHAQCTQFSDFHEEVSTHGEGEHHTPSDGVNIDIPLC